MNTNKKVLHVGDLIESLKTLDPDLPLVWADESRQELLSIDDIRLGGGNLWFFCPKPNWNMKFKDACDPLPGAESKDQSGA